MEVVGADVAPALVQVARAENATQLVLGATHRSRLAEFVRGSVINSVIRAAGGALDVHVIATDSAVGAPEEPATGEAPTATRAGDPAPRPPAAAACSAPLSARRRAGRRPPRRGRLPAPHPAAHVARARHADLATALSSYLVLVVAVAATGGVWPGVLAAVAGFLLSNYYFAPPVHTFTIADARDVLALVMFLVTAGVVSVLVDVAARRTAAAVQARSDARMLARVAGRLVSPEGNPLPGPARRAGRRLPPGVGRHPPPTGRTDDRADGAAGGDWTTRAPRPDPTPSRPRTTPR